MENDPRREHLVKLMLGHQVVVEYLAGPPVDTDEALDKLNKGEALVAQPEARTRLFYLWSWSQLGIEVTIGPEPGDDIFLSWTSVLRMWGYSREDLERHAREADEAAKREQAENQ